MNAQLKYQRTKMKEIIGFIDRIEECEDYMRSGYKEDFYRSVRTEARELYAQAMRELFENACELSKVEL